MAATVMDDLTGAAAACYRHPLDVVSVGGFEYGGDVGVAVQAGGDHMVEPGSCDIGEIVLGDQPTVGDQRDAADSEPVLEVGHHRRHGGRISCVAGERVVVWVPETVSRLVRQRSDTR